MSCIITGAGTGIGRAAAVELSKRDKIGKIYLLSLEESDLIETAGLMKRPPAAYFAIDLTDYSKVAEVVESIQRKNEGVDYLLNIAGIAGRSLLETSTLAQWEKTFAVNVFSVFHIIQLVIEFMNDGGTIINIGSTSGVSARPEWMVYASSKAALINFSNTLSEHLAPRNISVFTVSPGRCATEMRTTIMPDEDQTGMMAPEEVARVLNFLCSPDAYRLRGQNIVVK
jgi:NAD(P)-dependent dehydrogenase (short-subunit alcohol dehydrogenase family)